jgi:cytochrome c-type biogenesis protein CcmH
MSVLGKMRALAAAALFIAALPSAALAVQPDEILSDPVLESRARDLSAELRCLVCQNQSIDDSDAPLARDLRLLVRERLKAGDDEAQVIDFIVARYGEFVLLRPRFSAKTLLLWFAPFLLLAGGGYLAYRLFGNPGGGAPLAPEPLSEAEKARLKRIFEEDEA